MRCSKKKRLEAKGWKVGNAKGFLGLSSQEEAYVEIKLRLAEAVRDQRLRRQMTQSDLAKAINSSQSRVAKMEAGESSVSLDLLVRTLLVLGTHGKNLTRLLSSRGNSNVGVGRAAETVGVHILIWLLKKWVSTYPTYLPPITLSPMEIGMLELPKQSKEWVSTFLLLSFE